LFYSSLAPNQFFTSQLLLLFFCFFSSPCHPSLPFLFFANQRHGSRKKNVKMSSTGPQRRDFVPVFFNKITSAPSAVKVSIFLFSYPGFYEDIPGKGEHKINS